MAPSIASRLTHRTIAAAILLLAAFASAVSGCESREWRCFLTFDDSCECRFMSPGTPEGDFAALVEIQRTDCGVSSSVLPTGQERCCFYDLSAPNDPFCICDSTSPGAVPCSEVWKGRTLIDSCSLPPSESSSSSTGGGDHCESKEFGTTFASCTDDGDCFGGYCNADCNPGPCCAVATDSVIDSGRSYTCSTDKDCAAVAPDLVSRGGKAACVKPANTMKYSICAFTCPTL